MEIFMTGATGYIGAVVAETLLERGHRVFGLARSNASAEVLNGRGIEPVFGDTGARVFDETSTAIAAPAV